MYLVIYIYQILLQVFTEINNKHYWDLFGIFLKQVSSAHLHIFAQNNTNCVILLEFTLLF